LSFCGDFTWHSEHDLYVSVETKKEAEEDEEETKAKRVPLSLEELLAKKKAEEQALSKVK